MVNKYSDIKIRNEKGKGDVYAISLSSDFTSNQTIYTTYTPSNHERLDNIAYKFYDDPSLWWVIAKANKIVDGGFYAKEGQTLVIPEL